MALRALSNNESPMALSDNENGSPNCTVTDKWSQIIRARCYPLALQALTCLGISFATWRFRSWIIYMFKLYHVYTWHIPCLQDTVLTVPPYPFVLDDPTDVPIEASPPQASWIAHPSCFPLALWDLRVGGSRKEQWTRLALMTITVTSWSDDDQSTSWTSGCGTGHWQT